MSSTDLYQQVTDDMIARLQAGTVPWHQGWVSGLPVSMSTGRFYRGINTFILGLVAMDKGYETPWWGTYKKIAELGGQVRKGERSTLVVFWKRLRVADEATESGYKIIPLLRSYRVFNAEQADGLPDRYYGKPSGGTVGEVADAELIIKDYLARDGAPSLAYGGHEAYYVPATDAIQIPPRESFEDTAYFYETNFHEITHSTGHSSRLARPGMRGDFNHFGSDQYGREELVAGMGAAMLCALTGTDQHFDNSAAYIAGWLREIAGDPKLVVQAAAQATRAVDFIRGITYDDKDQES